MMMACATAYLQYVVKYVLMNFFNTWIEKGIISRLSDVVEKNFVQLTYTDAIELLLRAKKKFEFPVKWGCDLQSEHECYITEEAFSGCPVIIRDYLKEIKAFYMQQNDDGKTVAAMDLLVPRVGELIGGSQREERLEYLEDRLDDLKLNKDSFWWYLDLRRYGSGNNEIISLIEDPSGPSQVPNTQTENQLISDSQPENATKVDVEAEHRKKRKKKTSKAWDEFTVVTLKDGTKKVECKHCHSRLALQNSGSTSHLNRHMNSCSIRLASIFGSGKPKQQADEDSMQEVSLEIEVLMQ